MRVMVIVKSWKGCAAGAAPNPDFLDEMRKYNDALANAGILLSVDRLQPVAEGARVRLSGPKRTVLDGPFAETKELIGGFWMWEVKSIAEAIEWIQRCPNPPDGEVEIEIRQVIEPDGFAPALERKAGNQVRREQAQVAGTR